MIAIAVLCVGLQHEIIPYPVSNVVDGWGQHNSSTNNNKQNESIQEKEEKEYRKIETFKFEIKGY
tara:strand:- start:116 stop:310 length:195 start_codon:yes stop_codon:yes gene_type:complete